jgi:hypothetical protein
MATFAQLVADVKILTNRPDLDSEIKLAVKAATLKAHHTDFYPKDLFETGITWSPVGFTQSLTYRTLIPRWRSFNYLRKLDSTGIIPGAFFKMITPENSVDEYYIDKVNVCYLAGEDMEIKSSTEDAYMLLGCYLHPDITEAGYTSWIALDHPYAIEYEATSKIFKQTGFDEQAAMMNQEVSEQFMLLKNANILGQGY